VVEVLKGRTPSQELILEGYLSDRDDFNDRPVPYDFVRPEGRHGDCFASSYRGGAEHLLLLRIFKGEARARWGPLAPTNEQVTGADDPWVNWVRAEVARQKSQRPE
jgi:hypothetical protein